LCTPWPSVRITWHSFESSRYLTHFSYLLYSVWLCHEGSSLAPCTSVQLQASKFSGWIR
jgi:hypothetical protein